MELEEEDGQFYRAGDTLSVPVSKKGGNVKKGKTQEVDPSTELVEKIMKNASEKIESEAKELIHKLKKSKFDEIE
jgi:hypothetical protein